MKEVIRLEKREEAVSPVIATILMVAITVVLAATVYVLVSHYTTVGANRPLTASLAEISESGGAVSFSLTLSSPSNITSPSNIGLSVSGPGITGSLGLKYTAGTSSVNGTPGYWSAENGSSTYYIVVTITNPNGVVVGSGTSSNYVASGATINLYVTSGAPSFTSSSSVALSNIASSASISGLSISMTVSGYSGAVSATAP